MAAPARLIAVLVAAALVVAGCGSGDAGPQTKEGFVAAADSVCQKLFSEFERAGAGNPTTPRAVAEANDQLADLYERLADELGDVRLPDAGTARRQAQAFVGSVRAAEPLLTNLRAASKRFVAAAAGDDRQALTTAGTDVRAALDAFRSARAASDRLAVEYGLSFCGNLG